MSEESPKPKELPSEVREQIEKLLSQVTGVQEITSQAFAARQGFYEKLILLDGATLTLLFSVIGGISHSAITKEALDKVGQELFIGCWLFILSIMVSILHNHLNIATLIHMTSAAVRTSVHGSHALLRISMKKAGITDESETIQAADPEVQKDLKKGAVTENLCRWVGTVAQAATIFGYVVFVASLHTVIQAIAGAAH